MRGDLGWLKEGCGGPDLSRETSFGMCVCGGTCGFGAKEKAGGLRVGAYPWELLVNHGMMLVAHSCIP